MKEQFETVDRLKIAMLIDGDNAQPSLIQKILAEIGKHGQVTIRRIYGDWTTTQMNGWKGILNKYAIQPMQQFRYTVGKNSTDNFMIIDSMDLLYSGFVNGFCIVSSDSDYTRLATRIRENGFFVMGIGEEKTPESFVKACIQFTFTENLSIDDINLKKSLNSERKKGSSDKLKPIPLLKQAYDMVCNEDGWAHLGTFGNCLSELDPGFDSRTYGYRQLSQLMKAYSKIFELKEIQHETGSIFYVRLMNNS